VLQWVIHLELNSYTLSMLLYYSSPAHEHHAPARYNLLLYSTVQYVQYVYHGLLIDCKVTVAEHSTLPLNSATHSHAACSQALYPW